MTYDIASETRIVIQLECAGCESTSELKLGE